MTALRLGTRRSALATAQAQLVADALTARTGRAVELVPVTTYGDTSREALAQIGGTGVFVTALRDALLAGEVDFAVHSLKDLPTAAAEGILLAAVPPREDPRDVLVARDGLTLGELPDGARVGTGSPRRAAQLRALGSASRSSPVRGNVDTRLRLVERRRGRRRRAGPRRAGPAGPPRRRHRGARPAPDAARPRPGRAGGRVPCSDDAENASLASLLEVLDDAATRHAVTAERTLLAALEAGCSAPVGAYGEAAEGEHVPELYLRPSSVLSTARPACGCPPPDPRRGRTDRPRPRGRPARRGCGRSDVGARPVTRPKTTGKSTSRKPTADRLRRLRRRRPRRPRAADRASRRAAVEADVVVTESQDADFVRRFCRDDVEVVDGSLGDDGQPLSHAVRARLVVKAAKGGGNVVRLLDGDPFLYATGSEEAVGCAKAGIPFEVVPGVSAISAVPAYAGIPLTSAKNREVRVVDVAEGQHSSTGPPSAPGKATLVLLSSTKGIGDAAKALVAAGRAPETPVAMTQLGTTTAQRTVTSTLASIAADVKAAKLAPPTITVVGDTVALREKLSWFETKPLFGWRVLVPRTKEQAGALSERLRAYGAVPEEVPTIAVEPPRTPAADGAGDQGPGDRPLRVGRVHLAQRRQGRPGEVRGVRPGRPRLRRHQGRGGRRADRRATCWPGASSPTWCPAASSRPPGCWRTGRRTTRCFDPIDRVFLPRADIATENLVAGLVELGWEVDDVTAYRTVRAAPPAAPIREAIKSGGFDAVVFTSSSTVRNLVGIAGKPHTVHGDRRASGRTRRRPPRSTACGSTCSRPTPSVADLASALAEYGDSLRAAAVTAGEPVLRPSQKRATARRKAT